MLARSGMIGLMAFANKIECESHQLERPRPRAHALALTRTTGISPASQEYRTGALNLLRQDDCQGAAAVERDGDKQGMYLLSYQLLAN